MFHLLKFNCASLHIHGIIKIFFWIFHKKVLWAEILLFIRVKGLL